MDSNAWSSLHNPSCKSSYFNQLYHGGAASQNASNYSHYPYGNYGKNTHVYIHRANACMPDFYRSHPTKKHSLNWHSFLCLSDYVDSRAFTLAIRRFPPFLFISMYILGASSPYTPHQYETATASSSLPPQAAFVSCQQAVEQYSPYSHSSYAYGAGYGPYPFGTAISGPNMYQPMSGASLPQTNSSGSSSPTYQSQGQTATG